MFSIEQQFDDRELDVDIDAAVEGWFLDLVEDYRAAARKFIDWVRSKSPGESWNNITWNLRSSLGYIVLYKGQIVDEYSPSVGGGVEGSETGKAYGREIALLVNEYGGVQLVLFAGMDYAVFVEDNNKDVLTHSSKNFPKILIEEFKNQAA